MSIYANVLNKLGPNPAPPNCANCRDAGKRPGWIECSQCERGYHPAPMVRDERPSDATINAAVDAIGDAYSAIEDGELPIVAGLIRIDEALETVRGIFRRGA